MATDETRALLNAFVSFLDKQRATLSSSRGPDLPKIPATAKRRRSSVRGYFQAEVLRLLPSVVPPTGGLETNARDLLVLLRKRSSHPASIGSYLNARALSRVIWANRARLEKAGIYVSRSLSKGMKSYSLRLSHAPAPAPAPARASSVDKDTTALIDLLAEQYGGVAAVAQITQIPENTLYNYRGGRMRLPGDRARLLRSLLERATPTEVSRG